MNKMKRLKQCPFCGNSDMGFYDNGENNFWVYCKSCYAEGGIGKGKDGAVKAWNTRYIKEKITEMLNEANESNVSGRPDEVYIRLDARIRALGDVLELLQ